MDVTLTFYRGEIVTPEFVAELVAQARAGAALSGVTITNTDAELLSAMQWSGVSTPGEAYTKGKALGDATAAEAASKPTLTALNPATATIGDPNFTLSIQGSGFKPDDTILWNGAPEPTTFVSETELTTGVNMATATAAATIPVVVVRAANGEESNALEFDLQAA